MQYYSNQHRKKFIKELRNRGSKEYYFREQTLLWKDTIKNEYIYYTSVILETCGYNRFDYSAFDYGFLPENQDTNVILYICEMKIRKIPLDNKTYIEDPSIWDPAYKIFRSTVRSAF
jgi:hypothetical protein